VASIKTYVNGAGGSSGADLATLKPLYTPGTVYYVGNTVTGNSDSNAGTERTLPWATASHAQATVSSGDSVVFLAGHSESIGSLITWSQTGLSLVGEGSGTTIPRFTNATGATMWSITGAGYLLDTLYFPSSSVTASTRISTNVAGHIFNALSFDCGTNDTGTSLLLSGTGANNVRVTNSVFKAVAACPGLGINNTGAISDLALDNVTFDAGSFQWTISGAKVWNVSTGITRLRATRLNLYNGSVAFISTGTTGYIQVSGQTGDSQVNWTP
jgi:hypothetical protein